MKTIAFACMIFSSLIAEVVGGSFFEANQQAELPGLTKFPPIKIEFNVYTVDQRGYRLSENINFDFPARKRFVNTVYTVNNNMYVGEFSRDVVEAFPFKKVPSLFSFKEENMHDLSKESLIFLLGPPKIDDWGRLYWGFYTARKDKTKFQWVQFELKSEGGNKAPKVYVGEAEIETPR